MVKDKVVAMETALANEGINFPGERGARVVKRLLDLGWEVTKSSNWSDREPQLLNLVQDEL